MPVTISPEHPAIAAYYDRLNTLKQGLKLSAEGSTRRAFSALLDDTARARGWTLAEEVTRRRKTHRIRLDGVLYGKGNLPRGYWEAKDTADNLDAEILKKRAKDYPISNIIFEDTTRAVLLQDNIPVEDIDITDAEALARLLTRFYNYDMAPFEEFNKAVEWFAEVIPDMGRDLKAKIDSAHADNKRFQAEFDEFMALCRKALNPNISTAAVDEMLIQHLLTERLIRNIFQPGFNRRNIIAKKVEDVIDALTASLFDRAEFQQSLDPFYTAIERAAKELAEDYQEQQHFINTVYEQFFQGYSVRTADTHGIVYTPQEIVDFMCAAVEEVLHDEFGKRLGEPGVAVLDPATGTGNFIINLLNRVNPRYRRDFYRQYLFANEVMLMPYYIASLNIEHAYYELEGTYEPFEGLAFVDTLDLAKRRQLAFDFMTEENSQRVQRQQNADITVIIGNPPYNVGQLNENDNNKNRVYSVIDEQVSETYARDSSATNKNALSDVYVKFFRWATDRLAGRDGVVCYVTNNSFVDGIAFDGMRKHLLQDFHRVYHLDLHGNVRQNPKLSGTTHNVFGIQVGVGITVAVRSQAYTDHRLFYHRVPELWRKQEKLAFMTWNVREDGTQNALNTIAWEELRPNDKHVWLLSEHEAEYEQGIPIGTKADKKAKAGQAESIFKTYGRGVATSRDTHAYNYSRDALASVMQEQISAYNAEVDRYRRAPKDTPIDDFVSYETVNWSESLKSNLKRGNYAEFTDGKLRLSLYRPFTKRHLFFDSMMNERQYQFPRIFPTPATEAENRVISLTDSGSEKPFMVIMTRLIPDLHIVGAGSSAQCFPFYVYDEDGTNRRENITDWALAQFRQHYQDASISKWDIFYYVYGLLHHPEYRTRYADNLKRELPRLPFAPGFRAFVTAGEQLAALHLDYETAPRYPGIVWETTPEVRPSYRVEKMRPGRKADGPDGTYKIYDTLKVNDYLTLTGIPPQAFAYRLGNRSALDWVVDQYRVKTDKRSGITSDPNTYHDDPQYIVQLVERVVTVSVETARLVDGLAAQPIR